MIIAIISIISITALVYWLNRFLPFKVCPICAGVSLTWLGLIVGVLTGQLLIANSQLLIALLMGGTIVGIAYQGEKRFIWAAKSIWRWKIPAIILGFILFYELLLNMGWKTLAVESIILGIVFYVFFVQKSKGTAIINSQAEEANIRTQELEKKMEECC